MEKQRELPSRNDYMSKTLQELDGEDWGEPNYASHLVIECHRLHCTPLCELRTEDLRPML